MNTPKLKVQKLSPNSYEVLKYESESAAGLDLRSMLALTLYAGERCKIPTGIAVEIPEGYEGTIRPRSSLSVSGLHVFLGTIDSDYRGELAVVVQNLNEHGVAITIEYRQRIAQLVISPVARCEIEEVQELSTTIRGTAGFGSTGST